MKSNLNDICTALDVDGDGFISYKELLIGYQNHKEFFDTMHVMDVDEAQLALIFRVMDRDRSGRISYEEFADELFKMKTADTHAMLLHIKCYLQQIHDQNLEQLTLIKQEACLSQESSGKQLGYIEELRTAEWQFEERASSSEGQFQALERCLSKAERQLEQLRIVAEKLVTQTQIEVLPDLGEIVSPTDCMLDSCLLQNDLNSPPDEATHVITKAPDVCQSGGHFLESAMRPICV